MKTSNNWLNIIQNYLLPPTCILCGFAGDTGLDLCSSCHRHLPRNTDCCYQCAEVFPQPISFPCLCGRCLQRRPAFDETHAPFLHQGAIRHLISQLKFNGHYKNARLLGCLLAEHIDNSSEKPELLIPIPLHPSRYRQRGFNQAIEIARTVSKQLHIPLDLYSCQRQRDTPHQTSLTAKQRRRNIKNAFTLRKPITAQHVAILDDVMTTGATAHELAKTLKQAGVMRVDVWVCARA